VESLVKTIDPLSGWSNSPSGKAGLSPDAASAQLSSLLPDMIDTMTPSDKIEVGGIDQLFNMFQEKMGV